MSASAPEGSSSWRTLLIIARDRDYRGIFVCLLLLGFGAGIIVPYVTLWVIRSLHGTSWQAAFMFVPAGAVGLVLNLGLAVFSDRLTQRRPIILLVLVVGASCRLALAFVPSYGPALAIFALTGLNPSPFLFALLGDLIRARSAEGAGHSEIGGRIVTSQRMAFSIGFLGGPVLGAWAVAETGYRGLFLAGGILVAVALVWSLRHITDVKGAAPRHHGMTAPIDGRLLATITLLAVVSVLVVSGTYGRAMFLPLDLTGPLHTGVVAVGWAYSASVLAELVFMPLAGGLADRFGVARIYTIGVLGQVAYFCLLAFSWQYWEVVVLQVGFAAVISVTMGVGIVFAQRLVPAHRTALATTTYLSTSQAGPVITSLVIGSAVARVGLPHAFLGLAVLGGAAAVAVAAVLRVAPSQARTALTGGRRGVSV